MHRADLIIGLLFTAFGVYVVNTSLAMPRFANIGANPVTAPGLVPGLLGVIIGLLGLGMALRALIALRRGAETVAMGEEVFGVKTIIEGEPAFAPEASNAGSLRLLAMLSLALLFGLLMIGRLPFWLATFLFVFATTAVLEYLRFGPSPAFARALLFAVGIGAAVAWAIPYVFQEIFLVRLP